MEGVEGGGGILNVDFGSNGAFDKEFELLQNAAIFRALSNEPALCSFIIYSIYTGRVHSWSELLETLYAL